MAREPKGFSKSASGAYTAEDVSYAKQVKQQLAEIIQLQRDGADYDKARLKDLRQEGKLADDILKSRKQYVRAARDESIEFDNLAKNASREVKILNEGLGIRQVMVQVARAETQVAQGRYKNLTPETKAKRVLLDISKEILASSSQEIMTKDQIVDLEEKLAEASKANSKEAKALLNTLKKGVAFEKMKADLGEDALAAYNAGNQQIDDMGQGVKDLIAKFKVLNSGAVGFATKFGVALIIAKQLVDVVKKLTAPFFDLRNSLGTSLPFTKELVGDMKSITSALAESGIDIAMFGKKFEDVQQVGTALVDTLGFIPQNLAASSVKLTAFAGRFGVANDQAALLANELSLVASTTLEGATNLLTVIGGLAEAESVAPSLIMQDLAENTELFAEFAKDGGKNIGAAAIQARKLGVSLSTTAKISNSLLDFQSSIEKELEASLLIGKQLNFNKARELAFTGDIEGATKSVLQQIGGRAEFEKLNVFAKRALAESIGVDVGELNKLVGGRRVADTKGQDPREAAMTQNFTQQTDALVNAVGSNEQVLKDILSGNQKGLSKVESALLKLGAFMQSDLGGTVTTVATAAAATVAMNALPKVARRMMGKTVAKGGAEVATKATMKATGKVVSGAAAEAAVKKGTAEAIEKKVIQESGEIITKQVVKQGTKTAGKSVAKGLVKKIPIIGALFGVGFAIDRALDGDFLGAGGELLSGLASTVPGVGTGVSTAIDVGLAARDVSKVTGGIQENAVETQTPVNNVDDLIQLQTTESDKMKVTDAEMLFQLQELNKNMKKVDSSIQGLVD